MKELQRLQTFRQIVSNKFQIYNSLFMTLPYDKMSNIAMLLPFLYQESEQGFPNGETPTQIIDNFFEDHTEITSEEKKIDLLFRMIQYIERQVVLFDSIEDAAFPKIADKSAIGTISRLYQMANEKGKLQEVKDKLKDFSIRVVFTAHPTQFYTNNVQKILQELRSAIKDDSVTRIDLLLQQLGLTPFVSHEKPTPYDEAKSIIYYLRNIYYDSLGELYTDIKDIFGEEVTDANNQVIQLGFWPGGDRDGNPFVKASTTEKVAKELNITILKCYYNHIKELKKKITFRGVDKKIEKLSEKLYNHIFLDKGNISAKDLIDGFTEIKEDIIEKNNSLYAKEIASFIDRVKLFGTHFATLDIRQDSRIHLEIIEKIFQKEFNVDYNSLSKEEKIEYLTNRKLQINPNDYDEEIVKDTLENVLQLKDIQQRNGEKGVHRYIISNSETIFDVLHVYALFKYTGYNDEDIKFDIIPLFETIKGLSAAEETTDELYKLPIYAEHLKRRDNNQTIMLGFSDGTKDAGYVKANWEIYETKELLTRIANQNGIKVIFFDGRGGPPARGGGKTHQFYESQGDTIANHQIQLTIQGQTITSVYGTKEQSYYNFEQLLTAGVNNTVFKDRKIQLSQKERGLLSELAELSYQKYSELKAHDKFVPYLEKMSTLKYYGRTNIGSRPSKRGKSDKLSFSDLRAIPFVGSWSLLKQNVPGYYGFGTAINKLKEEGRLEEVKELFRNSAFFKTLVQNSMMSMTKTYFPLTFYMKDDQEFGDFWNLLYNEFLLSKEMMLEVSGYADLMDDEPISKASVYLRERIVLPLLTIQQYALQKIQEETKFKKEYEKMVMRCLFGNINASRNSA